MPQRDLLTPRALRTITGMTPRHFEAAIAGGAPVERNGKIDAHQWLDWLVKSKTIQLREAA